MKKVTGALDALQGALGDMETVLADDYVATPKERKPRQPRAPKAETDGGAPSATGKKPGRPKKSAE
ncbi:hypothetical protein [Hymenobacter nivis]|uniref:hypothetical protein n=1 Tax=Hymenobacter nivis TaxID=1850093 RepID=UPI0013A57283|nr:hypothetical protein [Hymenobacter nivis]